MEKLDKHYLCQVGSQGQHQWQVRLYPWYDVMNVELYLAGLPPNNPSLTMRKTSEKQKLQDSLQNTWSVLLKTVKVIKSKESEKLSQLRGA